MTESPKIKSSCLPVLRVSKRSLLYKKELVLLLTLHVINRDIEIRWKYNFSKR